MTMYIDGFIASVPTAEKAAYVAYTNRIDALFVEYGATRVVDSWGDDVPHGNITDFYRAVAAPEGETVVFGYIEWPDKATRTTGWDRLMQDERMKDQQPPFDGKRMVFGAFEAICVREK
jgi:uncharacterized protein YbaA (DUF1428 family)